MPFSGAFRTEWLLEGEGGFFGLGLGEGEGNQLLIAFVVLWDSVVMECQVRGHRNLCRN